MTLSERAYGYEPAASELKSLLKTRANLDHARGIADELEQELYFSQANDRAQKMIKEILSLLAI
jgi:hypothetical protein